MKELPKWMMRDPFEAYARIEEMEQKKLDRESKQKQAMEEMKKLFKESPDE